MRISVNVNEHVRVKLTDFGKQIYEGNVVFRQGPDKEGFYRFQLWDFMNIFGHYFTMGSPNIIENNELYFEFESR